MKRAKNIKKSIAIIILISMILCFCLYLIHFNHDCTHDDNCPICTIIHKLQDDLNGFNPNIVKVIITNLLFFSPLVIYLNSKYRNKKKDTLVGLKVELIN